jgi:leader peptidase (prepilin peptidase)/N-methyltransferase
MYFLYLFIIGLSIGSFLNVLIDRIPNRKSINGRSYCDHCKKQIRNIDLIPIFSYLALKGKCRFCHKKISIQYPIIELLTGAVFVLIFFFTQESEIIIRILNLFLASFFIVIFFSDLKYQIISDGILIFTFITSLFLLIFKNLTFAQISFRLIEGFGVALLILLVYLFSKGRSMGFGDVKLAYVAGFLLGFQNGMISLYLAFISGGIIGLYLIFFKKKHLKSKIAFGPFIIFGAAIIYFVDKVSNFVIPFFQY